MKKKRYKKKDDENVSKAREEYYILAIFNYTLDQMTSELHSLSLFISLFLGCRLRISYCICYDVRKRRKYSSAFSQFYLYMQNSLFKEGTLINLLKLFFSFFFFILSCSILKLETPIRLKSTILFE